MTTARLNEKHPEKKKDQEFGGTERFFRWWFPTAFLLAAVFYFVYFPDEYQKGIIYLVAAIIKAITDYISTKHKKFGAILDFIFLILLFYVLTTLYA